MYLCFPNKIPPRHPRFGISSSPNENSKLEGRSNVIGLLVRLDHEIECTFFRSDIFVVNEIVTTDANQRRDESK